METKAQVRTRILSRDINDSARDAAIYYRESVRDRDNNSFFWHRSSAEAEYWYRAAMRFRLRLLGYSDAQLDEV
jgi:hypothetical protein